MPTLPIMKRVSRLLAPVLLPFALFGGLVFAECPSPANYSSSPPQKVTDPSGADYFPSDLNTTGQPSACSGHGGSTPCAAHRVYKPARGASVNPQLLVFLPGTSMEPNKHDMVLQTAAYAGYRTIGLAYDNRSDPGSAEICSGKPACTACYGPAREEIVTGANTSADVRILAGDSIIRRLFQLLQKLHADDLRDGQNDDGWDAYLDLSNTQMPIVWRSIVISGFSQGAGHAAFMTQLFGARGLVMLDGGYDRCGEQLADWYKALPTAMPKYFVGHCRPPDIPCPASTATPLMLKRLGFPDNLYVLESAAPPTTETPAVSMSTQQVVSGRPQGEDEFAGNLTCNDHYSMGRDGCMPSSPNSKAAAQRVERAHLFEPYLARFCNACSGADCVSPRKLELLLAGSVQPTALSGKRSVAVIVGDETATDRALFGISSRERDDNPCQVTLRSENLNDPLTKPSESKTLCGEDKQPTSSILSTAIEDDGPLGKRGFMTGIQVCMDRGDDRVKGFAIIGHAINSEGNLTLVPVSMPAEVRTNCNKNHWQQVAACPDGHLATAAELHFEHEENEKRARSLTGVRLLCRRLMKVGFGPLP